MVRARAGDPRLGPPYLGHEDSPEQILLRVRNVLQRACVMDGHGPSPSEATRRRAFRAAINDALEQIDGGCWFR